MDRGTKGQRDIGTEGQRDRGTDTANTGLPININPKSQCDRENNVQQPAPVCKTKSQYNDLTRFNKIAI